MAISPAEQRLVRLFVTAVVGDSEGLAGVCAAAGPGEPNGLWSEALLQVHLFAGFPRTIEAFEVVRRASGLRRFEAGAPRRSTELQDAGDALFERIYAASADSVRGRLAEHHPDMARWIREHVYGRVLSRPGLAARMRELLAVAALAVTGPDRQLASHARGAVRCGATPEEVSAAVHAVRDLLSDKRAVVVRTVLRRFARAGDRSGP